MKSCIFSGDEPAAPETQALRGNISSPSRGQGASRHAEHRHTRPELPGEADISHVRLPHLLSLLPSFHGRTDLRGEHRGQPEHVPHGRRPFHKLCEIRHRADQRVEQDGKAKRTRAPFKRRKQTFTHRAEINQKGGNSDRAGVQQCGKQQIMGERLIRRIVFPARTMPENRPPADVMPGAML